MLRAKQKFDDAVLRIQSLDALYCHLTDTLHFPTSEVSDILRSELVYIISAFDKLIHDLVKQGMIDIFLGTRVSNPTYKKFNISLAQLEAINNATAIPSPVDILESIIINNHSYIAYQDPEKIASGLSLIWLEDHKWHRIANCMMMIESDVKVELKNIVSRRNQIVHEGDIDPLTDLPKAIGHADTVNSVLFIQRLGNCIYNLII